MPVLCQPIGIASEKCKSKMVADPSVTVMDLYQSTDPSVTVMDLYQSLDRFLVARGTNDLVALLKCMQELSDGDSPAKFGPVFIELKDLIIELIQWAPNCVLPRLRLHNALKKLNGDRRWHFANRSLDAAASEVQKIIRCVFGKLREIAKTSKVSGHKYRSRS